MTHDLAEQHVHPSNPVGRGSRTTVAFHVANRHYPDGDADRSRVLESARVRWAVVEDRFPRFDGEIAPVLVDHRIAREAFVTSWLENDKKVNVTIPGAARVVAKSIACESVAPGFNAGEFRLAPGYPGDCKATESFNICTLPDAVNIEIYFADSFTRIPSCIKNLVNLNGLNLQITRVSKIENLETLANLKFLYLQDTRVEKMEGLEKNKKLKLLNLSRTPVSKIEGLEKNKRLQALRLNGTPVSKIEGLDALVNLRQLDLSDTPVSTIENLDKNVKLETLWLLDTPTTRTMKKAFERQRPGVTVE